MEKREKNQLDHATYLFWKNQIDAAEEWRDKYNNRGDKIIQRYRSEDEYSDNGYNILYSNTETLAPVVYDSAPKAEVRALNNKRIATRKGAEMIESAINYYITNSDFDTKARDAVNDFLLPGMGLMRPKYKPLINDEDLQAEDLMQEVVFEEVEFEYVYWRNFIYPECSGWEHVPWIAFKTHMTYDEAADMFGVDKAMDLKYAPEMVDDRNKYISSTQEKGLRKVACVYEIWDKHFKEQIFFSPSANAPLEINDDPLELENFWPVPKPLFSITTSGNLLPVPFYVMYQDQAIELDRINSRIYHMLDNMKRRGFYDASIKELGNIESMGDNTFWPVKNWTEFTSKGGLNGVMQVEDITTYANILAVLEQSRQAILQDIFQIIGISDIRRAQTDPRETLGAQKLKSRYGTIRISTYQRKVAEFMRELLAITGEIIVKQFDAQTLAVITNMPMKSKVEDGNVKIVGVIDLLNDLRDKEPIDIAIDVQTDSTIIEDEEENRFALRESIEALTQFVQIAPSLIQGIGMDATSKIGMEIISRFKLGRQIHQDVEDYLQKLATEGLPEQKDPATVVADAELKKEEMRTQVEMMKLQINAQIEAANIQIKQQENMLKARELGIDAEFKQEKINLEALDKAIKMEGLKIEARSTVNEVVGV